MVAPDEEFGELILQIYRGSRVAPFAQFRDHALDIIKPALDFDTAKWGAGIHDKHGTFISSVHLYQLPPSMLEDYAKAVVTYNYAAARITAQLGRTVCIPWDDPEACREQNAAQRAYQFKYGILHLLSTALPDPALGLYHFLSLYRADPARPWTEAARQLKERLFPHLIEALMQARCLHMKKERGAEQGYAIADRTLSIANATPLFRNLVLLEWPRWNGDQMPPAVRAAWSEGKRLCYRGKQVVISMEPDQQLVHLMARRCNALDLLSMRELIVARLFARGLEHKDVAKEAGVSPHTVRNQIKMIYTKLGVSNKTELVACLADLS